jgi:hypothetical protein
MAALTNFMEENLLKHIFQNTDLANIGDATGLRGSSAAGSLYIALFTAVADGEAASVTEANYTGYARVAKGRNVSDWNVTDATGWKARNNTVVTFGACTAGSSTVTHFGIYTALSGGSLLFHGALTASLAITAGITPEIAINALTIEAQ